MGVQIQFSAALILMVQHVYLQDPSINLVTDRPFKCQTSLNLRCTPTTCCGSNNRFWYKGSVGIINSGTSTVPSKYLESNGTDYLQLTILNLEESDFDSKYYCSYRSLDSKFITLVADDYYCPPCWDCGGKCLGFSLIGVFIVVAVGAMIYKVTDRLQEKFVMFTVISGVTGLVVDVIVTLLTGAYSCLCELGYGPACIGIGFAVGLPVVLVVFLVFYFVLQNGSGGADSSSSRPPQGVRRPEIRESAHAGAHKRTENSSPKKSEYASKLDSVPKDRPLPQIGDNSLRQLPQLDQGKSNVPRLDPLGVTEDSGEKKKKKKKRKKQQENDEV